MKSKVIINIIRSLIIPLPYPYVHASSIYPSQTPDQRLEARKNLGQGNFL